MKKLFNLISLLTISISLIAQQRTNEDILKDFELLQKIKAAAPPATTQEEYTFATKGFKRVLTEAADMKRGYTYQRIYGGNGTSDGWGGVGKFDCYQLMQDSTIRALIVVYSRNSVLDKILCIPRANSESVLWQDYFQQVKLLTDFQRRLLTETLSIVYSNQVFLSGK